MSGTPQRPIVLASFLLCHICRLSHCNFTMFPRTLFRIREVLQGRPVRRFGGEGGVLDFLTMSLTRLPVPVLPLVVSARPAPRSRQVWTDQDAANVPALLSERNLTKTSLSRPRPETGEPIVEELMLRFEIPTLMPITVGSSRTMPCHG